MIHYTIYIVFFYFFFFTRLKHYKIIYKFSVFCLFLICFCVQFSQYFVTFGVFLAKKKGTFAPLFKQTNHFSESK